LLFTLSRNTSIPAIGFPVYGRLPNIFASRVRRKLTQRLCSRFPKSG
jgi:hypothetical protein